LEQPELVLITKKLFTVINLFPKLITEFTKYALTASGDSQLMVRVTNLNSHEPKLNCSDLPPLPGGNFIKHFFSADDALNN
jgi:hypothetical protein